MFLKVLNSNIPKQINIGIFNLSFNKNSRLNISAIIDDINIKVVPITGADMRNTIPNLKNISPK